jgi:hypothetical protein
VERLMLEEHLVDLEGHIVQSPQQGTADLPELHAAGPGEQSVHRHPAPGGRLVELDAAPASQHLGNVRSTKSIRQLRMQHQVLW